MKARTLLVIALSAAVPALACAKKPKVVEQAAAPVETVVEEEPVITQECMAKISLVHENVKNKQYADAYPTWLEVYNECPNANKSIYTNGAKIVDYLYDQATDPAEKERLGKLAVEMCDKRIKYFGSDPKYPVAYILGEKGLAYCDHSENDQVKAVAYPWLKESVEKMGLGSKILVLRKLFEVSYNLYKGDAAQYGEQFMADYALTSGLLQQMAANPANKNATAAGQQKEYIDNLFAISGAASCDKLDALYADYVAQNTQNMENLLKLIALYKRVNCTESEVYFAASEAAHKLQPSEESAAGCARMCMKKEDWRGAINYYNEAIALIEEDDDDDRDDYLYYIAYIYMDKLKNYPEARRYARQSLEVLPNQGRCYLLIGMCYAGSHPYSTDEYPAAKAAILNKTVFWAAVDQFVKAKSVDATCEADANKLIAAYSKYFPTKEEMFDLPNEFGGGTFIVGGWIGERTICRPQK